MKSSTFAITMFAIIFAFTAQSCDRSSDNMESAQTDVIEADRDLEIAQSEIEADVQIYRQKTASDIRDNNLAISDIKDRIENEDQDTRAAHHTRIAELEKENSDLKRKIDNYRITDRNNWDQFRDDFSSSMDDLGNSLDNFFSRTTTSSN